MKQKWEILSGCVCALALLSIAARCACAEEAKLSGVVRLEGGTPLAGAKVVLCVAERSVSISDGKLAHPERLTMSITDAEGRFEFKQSLIPFMLAAVSEKGYGETWESDFNQKQEIVVHPWGRIEGTLKIGNQIGAEQLVCIERHEWSGWPLPHIDFDLSRRKTDKTGHFVFENIPPIRVRVGRFIAREMDTGYITSGMASSSHWKTVIVKPGETTTVNVGGIGRPVIGRLIEPEGYKGKVALGGGETAMINSVRPDYPQPDESLPPDVKRASREKIYRENPIVQDALMNEHHFLMQIAKDGTFRVEDVPAGKYEVMLWDFPLYDETRDTLKPGLPRFAGGKTFEVLEIPGGRSDEPLDIGEVPLQYVKPRKPGN